jgi:amidohydrolase
MLGPVLNALYAIPSRRIDPLDPSVVSLGKVCGGSASNVIPATVQLEGTIRSFSEEVRRQLWHEVEQALALSRHLGGDYTLAIHEGYPAMTNDREVNQWLRGVARDFAGAGFVSDERFGMGAEDFAYMAQQAPGAMFMLGAALPDDVKRAHHTPIFNIDERVLPLGAAILAETARRFLRGEFS